jgi:hypothetical protein
LLTAMWILSYPNKEEQSNWFFRFIYFLIC